MLRNQIAEDLIPCFLPENCPQESVDLLMANILCGPLHELYPLFSALTRAGGRILLSGLLSQQQDQILETYASTFKDFEVKTLDDWIRISATRT
jgi:ribosomal protein L11 methyltransferase